MNDAGASQLTRTFTLGHVHASRLFTPHVHPFGTLCQTWPVMATVATRADPCNVNKRRGIHGGVRPDVMCVGKVEVFHTMWYFSPPLNRRWYFFAFLEPSRRALQHIKNCFFLLDTFATFSNFCNFWLKKSLEKNRPTARYKS